MTATTQPIAESPPHTAPKNDATREVELRAFEEKKRQERVFAFEMPWREAA